MSNWHIDVTQDVCSILVASLHLICILLLVRSIKVMTFIILPNRLCSYEKACQQKKERNRTELNALFPLLLWIPYLFLSIFFAR